MKEGKEEKKEKERKGGCECCKRESIHQRERQTFASAFPFKFAFAFPFLSFPKLSLLHQLIDQSNHNNQILYIQQDKPQFESTHSWLGIIAIAGVIMQSSTGIFKYLNLPRLTVHSHGLVGLAAWIVGMLTLMLGINNYAARRSGFGFEESLWSVFGFVQVRVYVFVLLSLSLSRDC